MQRKAQAALEFLSTYGFAFLIILVMIGALSYFGVLSPNKLIPNRCTMSAEFQCFEYQLNRGTGANNNATLNLVLINQLGNSVDFNTVGTGAYNATSQFGYTSGALTSICTFSPPTGVVGGGRETISCDMATLTSASGFPAEGEKVKVAFDFQYKELGKSYWVPVRGEILSTIN